MSVMFKCRLLHHFCLFRKKAKMVNEAVRLRFMARKRRFIRRSRASCFWALDTPEACKPKSASSTTSPLRLTMKHCYAHAPQYEAAPLHSAMKLSRLRERG